MDRELLELRGRVFKAAEGFHQAQRAYLDGVGEQRQSQEVNDSASLYSLAITAYETALDNLLFHFPRIKPYPQMNGEILRILGLLNLLRREQLTLSGLTLLPWEILKPNWQE